MIFSKKDNITIITQERASIPELIKKLNESFEQIQHDNIVINLTSLDKLSLEDILEFLPISNNQRGTNHSFVLVNNYLDIDEIPEEIIVVPTLQEAFDIIDMEEMERDLGL